MQPNRTRGGSPDWSPVAAVMAVLAVSNVMSNRVLTDWTYVPWNLGVTVVLVVIAVAVSSVAFGLWHVLPAIGIEDTNPVFADLVGGPVGAVVASNSLGFPAAWSYLRWR